MSYANYGVHGELVVTQQLGVDTALVPNLTRVMPALGR